MTRKEKFLKEIDEVIQNNLSYCHLEVYIEMPDLPDNEKIVNTFANMQPKRNYYERAYDDDLNLIANPDIKIAKWNVGSMNY